MAKRKLLILGLATTGLCGLGYSLLGDDGQDEDALKARHLANQIWIERMPNNERDMVGHLSFIKHPRAGRVGVAGRSSQWRHLIEIFFWKLSGSKLEVYMPQDEVRGTLNVRTWKCKGEAPEPFELCLEIAARGRKTVFYSKKEWIIDPKDASASLAELTEDNPELATVFEHAVSDTQEIPPDAQTYDVVDGLLVQ